MFSCEYCEIFKTPVLKIICERLYLKVKLNLSKVCKSSRVWLKLIRIFFFSKYCSCLNGCFWKCNSFKHCSNEVASLKAYKKATFLSDYFWDKPYLFCLSTWVIDIPLMSYVLMVLVFVKENVFILHCSNSTPVRQNQAICEIIIWSFSFLFL